MGTTGLDLITSKCRFGLEVLGNLRSDGGSDRSECCESRIVLNYLEFVSKCHMVLQCIIPCQLDVYPLHLDKIPHTWMMMSLHICGMTFMLYDIIL